MGMSGIRRFPGTGTSALSGPAKRSYPHRSSAVWDICGWRMFGKTNRAGPTTTFPVERPRGPKRSSKKREIPSTPPQAMGTRLAMRCPRQGTKQKGTRTACRNATSPGDYGDAGGPTDAVVSLDGGSISPPSLRFLPCSRAKSVIAERRGRVFRSRHNSERTAGERPAAAPPHC